MNTFKHNIPKLRKGDVLYASLSLELTLEESFVCIFNRSFVNDDEFVLSMVPFSIRSAENFKEIKRIVNVFLKEDCFGRTDFFPTKEVYCFFPHTTKNRILLTEKTYKINSI